MTNSTPVPTESSYTRLPEAQNTPKPTQDPSMPETQAAIVRSEPAQNRAPEAAAMQAPGRVPAVADSALPPPPVELQQFAQAANEFLRALHLQGQLIPLLKQVSAERQILREALSAGLAITPGELQSAADDFRTFNGLGSVTDMAEWLQREQWTASHLEAAVERDLLIAKFGAHLAGGATADPQRRQEVLDAWLAGRQSRELIDRDLRTLL